MASIASAMVACETTKPANDVDAPGPIPSYQEIADAQNRRVEHLQRTNAYGVIELRWEDKRGVHTEPQVDVELWLDLPRRTLVKIDKLGEDFFWIGSDERRFWSVDLTDKSDRIAVIRDRDDPEAWREFSVFGIEPDSLLDLMALRPLPLDPTGTSPSVVYDAKQEAWRVDELGSDGRWTMFFNPSDLTPRRVEIRDDAGQPVVYSVLSHYESVSREGVSVLALPKSPMWIDVYDVPGRGFTKIHLAEMTSDVDDERLERRFDVSLLMEHLRPDRIDDTSQAAIAHPEGG
jgi:hypothetical protein